MLLFDFKVLLVWPDLIQSLKRPIDIEPLLFFLPCHRRNNEKYSKICFWDYFDLFRFLLFFFIFFIRTFRKGCYGRQFSAIKRLFFIFFLALSLLFHHRIGNSSLLLLFKDIFVKRINDMAGGKYLQTIKIF